MPTNVDDISRKLSPHRRKKVEARVTQLLSEKMSLREPPHALNEKIERAFEQFERGEFF